jgi:hypothetical protein
MQCNILKHDLVTRYGLFVSQRPLICSICRNHSLIHHLSPGSLTQSNILYADLEKKTIKKISSTSTPCIIPFIMNDIVLILEQEIGRQI